MWTNDQQNAISSPVSNLLVTAAAGSGKTAVMVERIINRILKNDGVDIDKLLIVTFTNSAASEIKERIHLKIVYMHLFLQQKNFIKSHILAH